MRILITGATGLIGKKIISLCQKKGIAVNYLTTSRKKIKNSAEIKGFYWNPEKQEIDNACFTGVDAIINLVGASVFQRWTKKNKETILKSRVDSAELLINSLKKIPHKVKHICSASAIGIYPSSLRKYYYETEKKYNQAFLGEVVQRWEAAVDGFKPLGITVTKLRIGLVLSNAGGAFPKMKMAAQKHLGASFGSGMQWQSWIHLYDLSSMFLFAIEKELEGIYNAVAPNPVNSRTFNECLAEQLGKKQWIKKIPTSFLKFSMGEMSALVLESQRVSSEKIENEGFRFRYRNLQKALQNLV